MTAAHENVIGGMLRDQSAYWRIAEIVSAADFTGDLRGLFQKIEAATKAGEPYDTVTALGDGFDDAITIAGNTASTANIEAYARQVAGCSETRKVRDAGVRIQSCDTYAQALDHLSAVQPETAQAVKTVSDGLTEMIEALQARFDAGDGVTGVPTGVESLDELTGGWQPGNLIVLVGETSMGKSALALQTALAAAKYAKDRGERVLYFSLEMTAGELTERAVANLGDFPLRWITQPKDAPDYAMDSVQVGSRMLKELPLLIDDQSGLSLHDVVTRATQHHMRQKLAFIVVDYMHIMERPRRNDVMELGAIASGLKNLSKRLGVPVMALHQLNRSMGARESRRPTLYDIRASGEIAETANTVLAIYRSEVARSDFAPLHGTAEALILKQRQGRRDVRAWMTSRLANMRFESSPAPEGYDETICKDIESAGSAGSDGGNGGFKARFGQRAQPRPLSAVGSDH